MKAATRPRPTLDQRKLLTLSSGGARSGLARDLPGLLRAGDVLVLNDAATFPASLRATTEAGEEVELRLLPRSPKGPGWQAILFGRGSWRQRTEDRPPPPRLREGAPLRIGDSLGARVESVHPEAWRRVTLAFELEGEALWKEIYRLGRPIQYSYLEKDLELWLVQTPFSSRPWASEMPSAGSSLDWAMLLSLLSKGVAVRSLTHATGISSTGDPGLDAMLPLPEFFSIPEATVGAIERARREGGRVIAVGTSVVRALEGQAARNGGRLRPGAGETDLVIRRGFVPRIVDGILTGIHEVGESHFRLLEAFAPREWLEEALELAGREGYLTHEFGDACLILPT